MAKFHYDLSGAEPIIRDVPMYDSALIDKGEFIMQSGTGATEAVFITGYTGSSSEMVEALGISLERITTTSVADPGDHVTTAATTTSAAISSIAATVATGNRYGKAVINPNAVYLVERDQSSSAYITAAACSASTTYTETVEATTDGGWVYVVPGVGTAANQGQLRYISAVTSTTSWTLLTAMTTTTSEKIIKMLPLNHRKVKLDATATKTSDLTAHTASDRVKLKIVANYVGGKNKPLEALRKQIHDGITDTTLKFYSDVVLLDHCYRPMA